MVLLKHYEGLLGQPAHKREKPARMHVAMHHRPCQKVSSCVLTVACGIALHHTLQLESVFAHTVVLTLNCVNKTCASATCVMPWQARQSRGIYGDPSSVEREFRVSIALTFAVLLYSTLLLCLRSECTSCHPVWPMTTEGGHHSKVCSPERQQQQTLSQREPLFSLLLLFAMAQQSDDTASKQSRVSLSAAPVCCLCVCVG